MENYVSSDFIGKSVFVSKATPVYMSGLGKAVLFTAKPNVDIGKVKAIVRGSKQIGKTVVPSDVFYYAITLSNGKLGFVKYVDGDFNSFKAQGVRTDVKKGSDDKKDSSEANETFGDKALRVGRNVVLLLGAIYVGKEIILKKIG